MNEVKRNDLALSNHYNPFQKMERRCLPCYAPLARLVLQVLFPYFVRPVLHPSAVHAVPAA